MRSPTKGVIARREGSSAGFGLKEENGFGRCDRREQGIWTSAFEAMKRLTGRSVIGSSPRSFKFFRVRRRAVTYAPRIGPIPARSWNL